MCSLVMMQVQKAAKLYNPSNGKIVVSKDVEFDEEETWNWEKEECTYDLFPYFEENDEEVVVANEFFTPPPSPTQSIHEASSSERSSSERARKMRSLQDIYDETEIINDSFCLFGYSEPLTFEEAMENKRWRQTMKEEVNAIKKNDTWELLKFLKGHEANWSQMGVQV